MSTIKDNKKLKIAMLVIITLIVVTAVFLTIYFVEKNDKSRWDKSYIGQVNDSSGMRWSVESVDFARNIDGKSASEGNIWAVVTIEVTALKDKNIAPSDFDLSGVSPDKTIDGCLASKIKAKKGETQDIKLAFEVEESGAELRLYCYGYAVAIGSSLQGSPIL
ncbi:MAG: hypothetical protein SO434_05685 [Eubacteriales bacterium]|nr:hypothetical protein [Eubacteriales bacterium]